MYTVAHAALNFKRRSVHYLLRKIFICRYESCFLKCFYIFSYGLCRNLVNYVEATSTSTSLPNFTGTFSWFALFSHFQRWGLSFAASEICVDEFWFGGAAGVARWSIGWSCVYGPHSPKSKDKVSTEESAIVSALSEYASHGSLTSGFTQFDSVQDAAGEADMEGKPVKRHSAQT